MNRPALFLLFCLGFTFKPYVLFAQGVILGNESANKVYVQIPRAFKYAIPCEFELDSLYTPNEANLHWLKEEGEILLTAAQEGRIMVCFRVHNKKNQHLVFESLVIASKIPQARLVFIANGVMLNSYHVENLLGAQPKVIWPEVHGGCSLASYRVMVLMEDSSTHIFNAINQQIPPELNKLLKSKMDQIAEIVFFDVWMKSDMGKVRIAPVHFIGNRYYEF